MRGHDLLDKMELVDPSFVEEADKEPRTKKNTRIRYGALAACLAITVSAAGISMVIHHTRTNTEDPIPDGQGNYIVKHLPPADVSHEGPALLSRWDDMVDAQRYTGLQYADRNYGTRLIAVHKENTGDSLGTATVVGQDFYTDEIHSLKCDVYAIKNIDPKASLCVKFGSGDQYTYAYANAQYVPETLGEFIAALDLNNTLTTGVVYDKRTAAQTIAYEDITTGTVRIMLLSDTGIQNEPDKKVGATVMTISASVDLLGYHNASISLTEDGYLWTNILDTGKYFYIGEEKITRFVQEVTEKHQGYIYIYDEQTPVPDEE